MAGSKRSLSTPERNDKDRIKSGSKEIIAYLIPSRKEPDFGAARTISRQIHEDIIGEVDISTTGTNLKHSFVYFIINKLNGKVYVGKANDPIKRWNRHNWNYMHRKYPHFPLYRALKKYGSNNFQLEIIESFESEQLAFEAEVWWIAYLKTMGAVLYNCTAGGEGNIFNKKHTPLTKHKMSQSQKQRRLKEFLAFENS